MRSYVAMLVAILLIGCAGNQPHLDSDYLSVAKASLKAIEHHGAVVAVVLPSGIDPKAREAIASLRKVVSTDSVPQTELFELPDGYLLLQSFRIVGDEAHIEGTLGPVPRPSAGFTGCGNNFKIALRRRFGVWGELETHRILC